MKSIVYNQTKLIPIIDDLVNKLKIFKSELLEQEKCEADLQSIIEKETIDEEPELATRKTQDKANEDFMHLKRKDNFTASGYHDMYDNKVNPEMFI